MDAHSLTVSCCSLRKALKALLVITTVPAGTSEGINMEQDKINVYNHAKMNRYTTTLMIIISVNTDAWE